MVTSERHEIVGVIKSPTGDWCNQVIMKTINNCEPCMKNTRYHDTTHDRVNFRQT